MGKSLSKSLSEFLSLDDSFNDPYKDSSHVESRKDFIKKQKSHKEENKKEKKDHFETIVGEIEEFVSSGEDDELIDDFDTYLQDFMLEDADDNFRNELIKRGRQYTRNTSISKESSELQKLYAGNEQRIEELLREVAQDNEAVQKDINYLRAARSRNYKVLAELIGERRSYHDTTLSAIKELNAMNKAKVELQLKLDKENKDESGDSDLVANKAIQNLFSMGRDSLIGSYADVSGSSEAGNVGEYDSQINEDEIIHNKYFKEDEDKSETDGDKFLKYEGMGIECILEYDESGPIRIVAEDRDGNEIPDYPTIELTDDLSFTISENTGTATDNLSQKYKLRKI